jgi:transposase
MEVRCNTGPLGIPTNHTYQVVWANLEKCSVYITQRRERSGRFLQSGNHRWQIRGSTSTTSTADTCSGAPRRGRGMPHTPFRKVVNTVLDGLITGCRWCDLSRGRQWAPKSAAHRWLQRWQTDGTLVAMHARSLGVAEEHGLSPWPDGAVDGSFSPWPRRRRGRGPWR